jgi:hypothetical protein
MGINVTVNTPKASGGVNLRRSTGLLVLTTVFAMAVPMF